MVAFLIVLLLCSGSVMAVYWQITLDRERERDWYRCRVYIEITGLGGSTDSGCMNRAMDWDQRDTEGCRDYNG